MRMNEEQSKFSEIHQTRLSVRGRHQAQRLLYPGSLYKVSNTRHTYEDVTFDAIKTMCDLVSDTLRSRSDYPGRGVS